MLNCRTARFDPSIERASPDAGDRGPTLATALVKSGMRKIQVVKPRDRHRIVIWTERRISERTFAWLDRTRRLARNCERYARAAATFIRPAMLRSLTQPAHCSRPQTSWIES